MGVKCFLVQVDKHYHISSRMWETLNKRDRKKKETKTNFHFGRLLLYPHIVHWHLV